MNDRSDEAPSAVRVDSVGGQSPVADAPQTPGSAAADVEVAGAVSLAELARNARAKAPTTTTRPRATTTTTVRRSTTTTTVRPATTTTTTPARAASAPPPPTTSTTAAPLTPLTTLVQSVVPPAAAATSALTHSDSGIASWFKAPAATCAHRTLPMGTLVKVTRVSSGVSATCKVDDRGPTVATGRLIDLSLDTFEKLAHRDTGLIDVTIEW